MNIKVNGTPREVPPETSIAMLLAQLEYEQNKIAVALNQTFVPKSDYDSIKITENSELEIVAPQQGG